MEDVIYFLKRNSVILSIVALSILFTALMLLTIEKVQMTGTVLEHNVTADKGGQRTYSTIVRSDDGYIEEITGLNSYIVPVGGRVKYQKTRYKSIKF